MKNGTITENPITVTITTVNKIMTNLETKEEKPYSG